MQRGRRRTRRRRPPAGTLSCSCRRGRPSSAPPPTCVRPLVQPVPRHPVLSLPPARARGLLQGMSQVSSVRTPPRTRSLRVREAREAPVETFVSSSSFRASQPHSLRSALCIANASACRAPRRGALNGLVLRRFSDHAVERTMLPRSPSTHPVFGRRSATRSAPDDGCSSAADGENGGENGRA